MCENESGERERERERNMRCIKCESLTFNFECDHFYQKVFNVLQPYFIYIVDTF